MEAALESAATLHVSMSNRTSMELKPSFCVQYLLV